MYLLDTNVVSEIRRRDRADPRVASWIAAIDPRETFLSVVTVLELDRGILSIERRDSHQGRRLRQWLEDRVLPNFEGRILPVDVATARACARLHVPDPRPERDALIGATAQVHGLILVTRNVTDFEPMGVRLLDPWQAGPAA